MVVEPFAMVFGAVLPWWSRKLDAPEVPNDIRMISMSFLSSASDSAEAWCDDTAGEFSSSSTLTVVVSVNQPSLNYR